MNAMTFNSNLATPHQLQAYSFQETAKSKYYSRVFLAIFLESICIFMYLQNIMNQKLNIYTIFTGTNLYIQICFTLLPPFYKSWLPMDSESHGVWQRSHSSPLPHSVDRLAGPNSVGRSVSLQSAETGRGDLVGKYRFLRLKIWCILPDVLGYRCFFM